MFQRREPRQRIPDLADLSEGTITSLVAQKKDPDRVSVSLDDMFAFGLLADVVVAAGLKKGQRLTPEEQHALLREEERIGAKRAAMDVLSQRARTAREVRDALARRGFTEVSTEEAVADMERLGYLDDGAYARRFVTERAAGQGHGPQRLRADLIKRGVSRDAIDAALEELDREDLADSARALAAKRWHALRSEPDLRKRKKKTTDFLLRRGFGFDTARAALEAAMEAEPHEIEDDEWDA